MNQITRHYDTRYFIGLSKSIQPGINNQEIPALWDQLFESLQDTKTLGNFIGLEEYGPDFMESHTFTYSALIQVESPLETEDFIQKELPSGTYISFEIQFDDIINEIQKVYHYINEKQIPISHNFDYEDYLITQDYTKRGQSLYLSFLLE
jgi:predicted transcriptional regulator YdeE